jgi:hypothetical protein
MKNAAKAPRTRTWVKLVIAEPYPVMWSHVNNPYRRAEEAHLAGACYAPGATFYHFPEDRPFVEWQAAALRTYGYTITVSEEVR